MSDADSKLQQEIARTPDGDPLFGSVLADAPVVLRYLAMLAMTAFAAIVAVAVDSKVAIPNLSLIFVVPVIISAVGLGLGPSLSSAVLGALAYNFFLTEPRYTLMVDDPANIWAIGLLFVVGLIVSGVAFTSRRRAIDAAIVRAQAAALQAYSLEVVAADGTQAIVALTSQALAELFQVPVVVMLMAEGKVVSADGIGGAELKETELEAARSCAATGLAAQAGVYPAADSRFDFWPVATAAGQRAVLGLAFDPDERPSTPAVLVDIVGSLFALALDRRHFRLESGARRAG